MSLAFTTLEEPESTSLITDKPRNIIKGNAGFEPQFETQLCTAIIDEGPTRANQVRHMQTVPVTIDRKHVIFFRYLQVCSPASVNVDWSVKATPSPIG